LHGLTDDVVNLFCVLGLFVLKGGAKEAINEPADEHGSFNLDSGRLTNFQTDVIEAMNLMGRQHHHHLFDF
jgi:hypothetical protein